MHGNIFRIFVAVGDTVKKGTPLLIVEAMKMEHEILAPIDGIIGKINIEVGEQVSTDMELVSIKELDK
jgi:acetyl-CoA/propionyl-CoA carboxylase biotin carboxyl carrier protein